MLTSDRYSFSLFFITTTQYSIAGVTDISTNVEAKTVVVTHSDAVTKELMLEKLQKVNSLYYRSSIWHIDKTNDYYLMLVFIMQWSQASGKSVALAS